MRKEEGFLKRLSTNFKSVDVFFIQLTLSLIITGLIFAFSSSTFLSYKSTGNFWSLGIKQVIATCIGFILMIILSKTDYKLLIKHTFTIAFIILIIMLITQFSPLGKASGGSKRWIDILGFQFQPAETTKLAVLLLVSKLLVQYKWNNLKPVCSHLLLVVALIFLVLKQPDLGSASILFFVTMELLFVFGWPLWLLSLSIPAALIAVISKIKGTQYQMERITYWLKPELDPQGKGFNIIQAKYAFGLGNIFGTGLGNSIQKNGALPVAHSDLIFAVVGEEVGFLGVTAILFLFITWILRGLFLVNKIENNYGKILASGIIFTITTQMLINISVAVGLMPVTGVTLPFFSCGGTSIIVTLAMIGILFNILSTIDDVDV